MHIQNLGWVPSCAVKNPASGFELISMTISGVEDSLIPFEISFFVSIVTSGPLPKIANDENAEGYPF